MLADFGTRAAFRALQANGNAVQELLMFSKKDGADFGCAYVKVILPDGKEWKCHSLAVWAAVEALKKDVSICTAIDTKLASTGNPHFVFLNDMHYLWVQDISLSYKHEREELCMEALLLIASDADISDAIPSQAAMQELRSSDAFQVLSTFVEANLELMALNSFPDLAAASMIPLHLHCAILLKTSGHWSLSDCEHAETLTPAILQSRNRPARQAKAAARRTAAGKQVITLAHGKKLVCYDAWQSLHADEHAQAVRMAQALEISDQLVAENEQLVLAYGKDLALGSELHALLMTLPTQKVLLTSYQELIALACIEGYTDNLFGC